MIFRFNCHSAGNVTLCCGQHVAHGLRGDRAFYGEQGSENSRCTKKLQNYKLYNLQSSLNIP
jgi:hypothetical protein